MFKISRLSSSEISTVYKGNYYSTVTSFRESKTGVGTTGTVALAVREWKGRSPIERKTNCASFVFGARIWPS